MEPSNVNAKCLLCFTELVTSIESIEDGSASCPKCHGAAIVQDEDD